MSKKKFDQLIKEKLEGYEPTHLSSDWSRMKLLIDQEQKDLVFDQKIKEVLQQAEAKSPHVNWFQFETRRQLQKQRRHHIIKARLIESFILLLLIWTSNSILVPAMIEMGHQEAIADGNSTLQKSEDAQINITNEIANSKAQTLDSKEKRKGDLKIISNQKKGKSEYALNSKPSNLANELKRSEGIQTKIIHALNEKNIEQNNSKPIQDIEATEHSGIQGEDINEGQAESTTIVTEIKSEHSEQLVESIDALDLLAREEELFSLNTENDLLTPVTKMIQPVKNKFLLQFTGGMMANRVTTPAEVSFSGRELTRWGPGFQGGASFFMNHGLYTIETGLSYQYLLYYPNMIETLGDINHGYFDKKFSSIEYQVVSIPIALHRNVFATSQFKVSIKAGMSFQLSLKNKFTVEKITNEVQEITVDDPPYSLFNNKKFSEGVGDGGSFADNSYMNLFVGSRIQYKLNSKLHLIYELQLNKMLNGNGFGPNLDKFFSIQSNMGIAFPLK
ncbi:MAG: PorT family protein [Bacteroidota bacterium]|nr:PorT family protein [Bacteroidota bacterium]